MLDLQEASQLLGCAPDELQRLLEESSDLTRYPGRGGTRLPRETVRALAEKGGKRFPRRTAVIGIEKGGVGKTFLTINAAVALSYAGCRVLVLDLDPEACATNFFLPDETDYSKLGTMLEVFSSESMSFKDVIVPTRYEGVDLVACKGKARRTNRILSGSNPKKLLKSKMAGIDGYDVVLFEVPPTFGDIISSAYLSSDLVVLPALPDIWSIESIALTMEDVREDCERFDAAAPEFRILLNRYSPARNASSEVLEELQKTYAAHLLPFTVRDSAPIQNAVNEGASIFEMRCPDSVRESIVALASVIAPVNGERRD